MRAPVNSSLGSANAGERTVEYVIEAAADMDGVGAGDTVQADVDSIAEYTPGLQCQVVSVLRSAP